MKHAELVYFEGCPTVQVLQRNAEQAIVALGAGWRLSMVNQETLPPDDLRRGYGSPSVLLDGREVFGEPTPSSTEMSCRVYAGGVPDAAEMVRALRRAAEER